MIVNFPIRNPFEQEQSDPSLQQLNYVAQFYQKTILACSILVFQLGFILFEYGSARSKNADTAMMKHVALLCTASLLTFLVAFGISYGDPNLVGSRFYLSLKMLKEEGVINVDEDLTLNYLVLMLSMSLIASMSTSAINERQNVFAQVVLGSYIQLIIMPLVVAWTFGKGFLHKFYLDDQTGCVSLHLLAGLCAMMSCAFIDPRLGKYQPL